MARLIFSRVPSPTHSSTDMSPNRKYLTQKASVSPPSPHPWTTHLHRRARLEMAHSQANLPTIPILSVIGEGRKWTHLFSLLVFFEVTQIEHLCPNWTGLQSLHFALSSLGKTWHETFMFSSFIGFELPCFPLSLFSSYDLTATRRVVSTVRKWWMVYRWLCR